ncbi:MAG: MotA/TolQ/ExbB proton channel family protein [Helicobacteraceae bacterium]|jgi:biopolymer transport protein ExbB|nr:MotA/TolQ/ExbB proton channel family protein [Helicobacteraceae bacterium]
MNAIVRFLDNGGLAMWLLAALSFALWTLAFWRLFFRANVMPLLKAVVAIAPLLGLFGTVMGMIEVFEAIAHYGSGEPRVFASGIARATFPTMAGLTIALIGMFISTKFIYSLGRKTPKKVK